tara:strand:- start:5552 stop:6154 length:603 start_codon:yes stop_codon:yes gene_type:complete
MSMVYNINNKKVLFIHIPKTGGSSVGTVLMPYMLNTPAIVGHQGYRECIRHYKPDEIFTVIRNPWDWRSSWYYYLNQEEAGHKFEHHKVTTLSFKNHLKWIKNTPADNFTNSVYGGIISKVFIKPQSEYLNSDNIKILRFENLKKDFENYMKELGVNLSLNKHVRKSANNNYKNEYDKESIKIVEDLWGEDITNFNYKFQ